MKEQLKKAISQVVKDLYPQIEIEVALSIPSQAQFGDYATNIAMVLAGRVKDNPKNIAQKMSASLALVDFIQTVSVAGPGFLNFVLKPQCWIEALEEINKQQSRFGVSKKYQGRKALVEFVSANPTGPLHIGHGRGAVVGDTVSRLLQAVGYDVTREYYVNDGGFQINTLGKSVYARLKQMEDPSVVFPEEGYQGDYIKDIALKVKDQQAEWAGWDESKIVHHLGVYAGDVILNEIKADLANTGIIFDTYFFESTLYQENKVAQTLAELEEKQLTYKQEGAFWLKSTQFGDDKDRVLIKNDGSYTYLTPDIAYHREKFKRGYDLLVNVWGADHAGYIPRLRSALSGLGVDNDRLHVLFIQMVSLIKGGQLLSMSTRRAQYETLENVVKAVGRDVARYFFMMRSHQAQLDFDLELATQQNSDNPVYYIQYAHARICSIFNKASVEKGLSGDWPTFCSSFAGHLTLPEELALTRQILSYPDMIEEAASELAPHRVAHYVLDLARSFQSYYDRARSDERYKVLQGDSLHIEARLFLLGCIRQVIQNALAILGVTAPTEM